MTTQPSVSANPLRRLLRGVAAVALVGLMSTAAVAQDAPTETEDGLVRLTPNEKGWKIDELFKHISKATGLSILYDKNNNVVKTKTIDFIGDQVIPADRLFDWLQAVLSFQGLVLVPVGPRGPTGSQQWFALDQASANLTTRPVYLDETEILDYADRDGLYVVTTFTLENISDTARVRTALSQLSTKTAGIGRINDIQGSRSLIVGDFAPIVAAMKKLLTYIDVENPRIEPRMEVIQLTHAVASELEPIIRELIEQSVGPQQPRARGQAAPDEEPEPKIMADPRLDALIIYAIDKHMNKIKELISKLDVPNNNYRQRIHFRPLKHTDAGELAELIQELVQETGIGGGSRTSSRNRTSNRTANAPAAPGAFGGGTDSEPVIIADPRSNSLIVHASPTQFDSIDDLITRLDTSRPQVLIETALVELSLADQLTVAVELFSVEDDVTVDTDGDGVTDAITDERSFFGSALFGLANTVTQDIGGVSVPVNRSPILGTGFTAGVFKNGRLPILLSALSSAGRAKILTMPSVVTNDNEEATISLSRTTSFRQNVRTDSGTDRESFEQVTATTRLTISPSISSNNYLRLHIDQAVDNFGTRPSPDAPPDSTSRTITTNVTIPDTYTVVLGGLVQEEDRTSIRKVPVLGDIPIIGWLFRQTDDQSNPSHLFLFVTPRILRDTENFDDYHRLSWERKLLQDDLFGSEVDFHHANFRGQHAPPTSTERVRELELSGDLDGARLKLPATEQERIRQARESAERLPAPPKPARDGE